MSTSLGRREDIALIHCKHQTTEKADDSGLIAQKSNQSQIHVDCEVRRSTFLPESEPEPKTSRVTGSHYLRPDEDDDVDEYLPVNHPGYHPRWIQSILRKARAALNQSAQRVRKRKADHAPCLMWVPLARPSSHRESRSLHVTPRDAIRACILSFGTNQFLRLSGTPSIRLTLMQQKPILEYFLVSRSCLEIYILYTKNGVHPTVSTNHHSCFSNITLAVTSYKRLFS